MTYEPITVAEVERALIEGCGDHGCRFVKPAGQGTNGGCRCFDRRPWNVLARDLAMLVLEQEELRYTGG